MNQQRSKKIIKNNERKYPTKIINSNDLHGAEPPGLDVISRVESHPHDLVGCNSELENKKTNH
jgi:hypothetical protein